MALAVPTDPGWGPGPGLALSLEEQHTTSPALGRAAWPWPGLLEWTAAWELAGGLPGASLALLSALQQHRGLAGAGAETQVPPHFTPVGLQQWP